MNGDQDTQSVRHIEDGATVALNWDRPSCQTLRRGCSKSDDKPWAYGLDLFKEPAPANLDFAGVGALMQPSLAARLKLEMLDRIGHINAPAVNARFRERPVEQEASWPDKWTAFAVFPIPGLLTNEHDLRVGRTFSEHRLGRIFPQWAGLTGGCFATQAAESIVRLAVVG